MCDWDCVFMCVCVHSWVGIFVNLCVSVCVGSCLVFPYPYYVVYLRKWFDKLPNVLSDGISHEYGHCMKPFIVLPPALPHSFLVLLGCSRGGFCRFSY